MYPTLQVEIQVKYTHWFFRSFLLFCISLPFLTSPHSSDEKSHIRQSSTVGNDFYFFAPTNCQKEGFEILDFRGNDNYMTNWRKEGRLLHTYYCTHILNLVAVAFYNHVTPPPLLDNFLFVNSSSSSCKWSRQMSSLPPQVRPPLLPMFNNFWDEDHWFPWSRKDSWECQMTIALTPPPPPTSALLLSAASTTRLYIIFLGLKWRILWCFP